SCRAGEFAWESEKLKHGVFFHYVLEGLRGGAKDADGEVTFESLAGFVRKRVAREVPKLIGEGAQQSPNLKGDLAGESLALIRVGDGTPPAEGEAREEPKTLTVDVGGGVKMEFVHIPAGKFLMGSPQDEAERKDHEGPQREVTISKQFYLGKYEVTQE